MTSRSFGRAITAFPEMEEAVASYTARAAEKLRRQRLATAHLAVATSDSGKLITAALAGLRAIWRDGYRYKKAGVLLLDLHPASRVQESLFDSRDDARRTKLMRTIDRINRHHGRDTISFAAAGIRRPWKMQRERLSPCYTTDWEGLLRV